MEQQPLPHNLEAEQAVLGGILIDETAYYDVADFLTPQDFYLGFHGQVFKAMGDLRRDGKPVDFITLNEVLTARGINHKSGTDVYLVELVNVVPTSINTEEYGRIVKAESTRRRLIRAGGMIATAAFDTEKNIDSVIEIAEAEMLGITAESSKRSIITVEEGLKDLLDIIEARRNSSDEFVGLPTGFADLDKIKRGMRKGDFIILAGRPGMGKSSLEQQIARNVAKNGGHVLRFNMEMSVEQSLLRLVAAETGIPLARLERGDFQHNEEPRYYEAMGKLAQLRIWLDHTPSLTMTQLTAKCRRLHAEHGLDLVTVDYAQLMGGERSASNRVQEVGAISRGLKRLALELHIPVLALAQLNRSLEQRADKRPQLSDLRETGDLENDADSVWFIYRDEYYNPDDSDRPNIAEVIVAKSRNGPPGTADLHWNGSLTKFSNLQRVDMNGLGGVS